MANKPGEANFFPDVPEFPNMGVFQPIYGKFDLTTYIQGASDYEIMAFLVGKYNACLEAYGNITKLSTDTITACKQLQNWINSWFTNLDVQEEINKKLDKMVADGSFETLMHNAFDAQVNQRTTNTVTAWLVANVTPTGSAVIVDKSLSIEGAAADAKTVGDNCPNYKGKLPESFTSLKEINITSIYLITNAIATTLIDSPTTVGGLIETIINYSGKTLQRKLQIYYTNNNELFFKIIPFQEAIDTAPWICCSNLNVNYILDNITDLNDISTGIAYQITTEKAKLIKNVPVEQGGIVFTICGTYYTIQIYLTNTSIYYRTKIGNFTNWNLISQNYTVMLLDSKYTDLNELTNKSETCQLTTALATTIANTPTNKAGFLTVTVGYYYVTQEYVDVDGNRFWRKQLANKFTEWTVTGRSTYITNYAFFGDSITAGATSKYVDGAATYVDDNLNNSWVKTFSKVRSLNEYNYAKIGTGYLQTYQNNDSISMINNANLTNIDAVVLAWGSNDWAHDCTLGTPSDAATEQTVCGKIKAVVNAIRAKNGSCKITAISPINRAVYGNLSTNYGLNGKNKAVVPYSINELNLAMKEVFNSLEIPLVDNTINGIVTSSNIATVLPDKTHPTIEVQQKLGIALAYSPI
jgi:hypothetical protein